MNYFKGGVYGYYILTIILLVLIRALQVRKVRIISKILVFDENNWKNSWKIYPLLSNKENFALKFIIKKKNSFTAKI